MDKYHVTVTFTEPVLGTVPKDPDIYETHIQSRAAELGDEAAAEELETLGSIEEKGWTGFHMKDGKPLVYDYWVRGFFKSACYAMRQVPKSQSGKLTAYKKKIDTLCFVFPRQIMLQLNGHQMGTLERPLRAQTARGERVALARSDTCPPGTVMEFDLQVLAVIDEELLREWLDYGSLLGFGQWRSGSYGRFSYELKRVQ